MSVDTYKLVAKIIESPSPPMSPRLIMFSKIVQTIVFYCPIMINYGIWTMEAILVYIFVTKMTCYHTSDDKRIYVYYFLERSLGTT